MARPSQYSQGRRIALQATLVVVLLGTLGLAALLGRSREQALAVEWTTKPHLTEHLGILLPKGWTPDERVGRAGVLVSATALKRGATEVNDIKDAREVVVLQTDSLPAGGAGALLGQFLSDTEGELGAVRPFEVLGEGGVVARFNEYFADGHGRVGQVPGWYAAVVLPTAGPEGRPLGVIVGAKGLGADGPAGEKLLRQLADGLSVRTH